jgi:hypothetical protein
MRRRISATFSATFSGQDGSSSSRGLERGSWFDGTGMIEFLRQIYASEKDAD